LIASQSINQPSHFYRIKGLAFAVNGVELLHLNNVVTGCILLGGLFFYDIFWVFGTDVMVTVAKSFEAPIKLVFPQVHIIIFRVVDPD
jgi:minor histocompatibility antigen H13